MPTEDRGRQDKKQRNIQQTKYQNNRQNSEQATTIFCIGVDLGGGQPGHAPPIIELVGQRYPFAPQ